MEEYEKIVGNLKTHEMSAKLADGRIIEQDGNILESVIDMLDSQEDYYMDSVIVVRDLGKALALVFVHAEIAEICANKISVEAMEVLEEYGIEYEYMEEVREIPETLEYDVKVKDVEDPMEAIEVLKK